jgi:cytochrome P450
MFRKSRTDPEYKRLGITEETAIAVAFEFFLASYEGVRTTLSLLTYQLAMEPEIQTRLLEELDAALDRNGGRVSSETVSELPFMTACLSETLRFRPSFYRLDRVCAKDWEYNGIRVKKGMLVMFPLYAVHQDPLQYSEPEIYDPDRFMPEKKEKIDPYALLSFGQGPRACIGQRFAYDMLKVVLAHYLKEFRIERRVDTVFREHIGNPMFMSYDPILVNFVRRSRK